MQKFYGILPQASSVLLRMPRGSYGKPHEFRHGIDFHSIRNLINRHISQLTLLQIGTEVIAMSGYQYTALILSMMR